MNDLRASPPHSAHHSAAIEPSFEHTNFATTSSGSSNVDDRRRKNRNDEYAAETTNVGGGRSDNPTTTEHQHRKMSKRRAPLAPNDLNILPTTTMHPHRTTTIVNKQQRFETPHGSTAVASVAVADQSQFLGLERRHSTSDDSPHGSTVHEAANDATMSRLFPIPNGHVVIIVSAVLLYSVAFLFYAQRHTVLLLIMTGLIAICILTFYVGGILSLFYLMLKIGEMEKSSEKLIMQSLHSNTNTTISPIRSITQIYCQHNAMSTAAENRNQHHKMTCEKNRPEVPLNSATSTAIGISRSSSNNSSTTLTTLNGGCASSTTTIVEMKF